MGLEISQREGGARVVVKGRRSTGLVRVRKQKPSVPERSLTVADRQSNSSAVHGEKPGPSPVRRKEGGPPVNHA